ncbi:hypothetical protein OGAPHI_002873 [Ogataea philodendri]|uniref:Uncharacterized protein n=1 Tax=Ogataea philodendri TaxID=1378263 RepID=A0A9P8P965_9ASCO|nr:uncharacterized protein OGAPHI_002873 [Ogataea philodendri]KAH3667224.1 hypothetical protein OGAPHI_002873 [Ogataea philodendri]
MFQVSEIYLFTLNEHIRHPMPKTTATLDSRYSNHQSELFDKPYKLDLLKANGRRQSILSPKSAMLICEELKATTRCSIELQTIRGGNFVRVILDQLIDRPRKTHDITIRNEALVLQRSRLTASRWLLNGSLSYNHMSILLFF